jgi:hypothetical protein
MSLIREDFQHSIVWEQDPTLSSLDETLISFFRKHPDKTSLLFEKETPLGDEEFAILSKHAIQFQNMKYFAIQYFTRTYPPPEFIKNIEKLAISCGRFVEIDIKWISPTIFPNDYFATRYRTFEGYEHHENPCRLEWILRLSNMLPLIETLLSPYIHPRLRKPNWRGLNMDLIRQVINVRLLDL